jgi:hypothetical protein
MRHIKNLIVLLTLGAALGLAAPARACPLCKEAAENAVGTSGDQNYDDDPLAEARAYNHSIFMMLGIPYTIFAVGGFYCYRHLRGRQPQVVEQLN